MTLEIPDHLYEQLCRYADENGIKEGQSVVAFALADAGGYQRLRHAIRRELVWGERERASGYATVVSHLDANGLVRRG
jgi:hypothetical protein